MTDLSVCMENKLNQKIHPKFILSPMEKEHPTFQFLEIKMPKLQIMIGHFSINRPVSSKALY